MTEPRRVSWRLLCVAATAILFALGLTACAGYLVVMDAWSSSSWAEVDRVITSAGRLRLEDDLGTVEVPPGWNGTDSVWIPVPVGLGQEDSWDLRQFTLLRTPSYETWMLPSTGLNVRVFKNQKAWRGFSERESSNASATVVALPDDVLVGTDRESFIQTDVLAQEGGTQYWHTKLTVFVRDSERPLMLEAIANRETGEPPLEDLFDCLRMVQLRSDDVTTRD